MVLGTRLPEITTVTAPGNHATILEAGEYPSVGSQRTVNGLVGRFAVVFRVDIKSQALVARVDAAPVFCGNLAQWL